MHVCVSVTKSVYVTECTCDSLCVCEVENEKGGVELARVSRPRNTLVRGLENVDEWR